MNNNIFKPIIAMIIFALFAANAGATEVWKTITPTDVFYLAKGVDDSLAAMYGLTGELKKKRISNNLRPRNVYEKVLSVADEFNTLHPGSINQFKLNEARNINSGRANPSDVFAVLNLIREYFSVKDAFIEPTGERSSKTPNDVFQLLRQISMRHNEIATQKNLVTDWSDPKRVYDAVITGILPVLYGIAAEAGVEHEYYPFPRQPVSGVIPRYVYKLLSHVYKNISRYYTTKGEYDPIILVEVNDCDELSPADVFDLTKVITAELKAKSGTKTLPSEVTSDYSRWRSGKQKIVPGDVFRLIQHAFILSKKMLE